jgi:hypothetical protein
MPARVSAHHKTKEAPTGRLFELKCRMSFPAAVGTHFDLLQQGHPSAVIRTT